MINHAIALSDQIDSFLVSNIVEGMPLNTYKGKFTIKKLEIEDWEELDFIKQFLFKFNVYTKGFESDQFPTLG